MTVLNEPDRFHLVIDVIDRVASADMDAVHLKQRLKDKMIEHRHDINEHGEDLPQVHDRAWGNEHAGELA